MTKQEITKKLEELEREQFELMMKDMCNRADYELDSKYTREIETLREALKKAD